MFCIWSLHHDQVTILFTAEHRRLLVCVTHLGPLPSLFRLYWRPNVGPRSNGLEDVSQDILLLRRGLQSRAWRLQSWDRWHQPTDHSAYWLWSLCLPVLRYYMILSTTNTKPRPLYSALSNLELKNESHGLGPHFTWCLSPIYQNSILI